MQHWSIFLQMALFHLHMLEKMVMMDPGFRWGNFILDNPPFPPIIWRARAFWTIWAAFFLNDQPHVLEGTPYTAA